MFQDKNKHQISFSQEVLAIAAEKSLNYAPKIEINPIFTYLQLSPYLFNPEFEKEFKEETSPFAIEYQDFLYFPPIGWKGYGLKLSDEYDDGDRNWIDGPKYWATAFPGQMEVEPNIVGNILEDGLKPGMGPNLRECDLYLYRGKHF